MNSKTSMQDDLNYVANAVRRRERSPGVPQIFFLWAGIIAIGWALPDFAPRYAGWFWIVAGPAGGLLSWWLGARHAAEMGDIDREEGLRHGLHWLVAGAGFFGIFLPFLTGSAAEGVSSIDVGRQVLLVATLAYALAAVHLERGLVWPSAIMAAGYVALAAWTPPYLWTTLGAVVALSLIVAGIQARR